MTHSEKVTSPFIERPALVKQMLIGLAIGFIVICSFVLRVKYPNPAWGSLWMVRPLILTPFIGAICGACFYFMDRLRQLYGWDKAFIVCISIIGYMIGLWMGVVLGLVGTLWN